ncbi:glycoside hydrolase family 61 protein, partial [Bipolaris maydis ATCC 48331]
MKLSLLTAAAIAQIASAHYFFERLIIDGKETKPYEFVRENTRAIKYNPTKWKNPLDNITPDDTDFRCNKGAFSSASRTGVAEVAPGTKLAMKLGVGATMQHPGPGHVHMSLAPGSVKEYEGDGDWFLIKQVGLCTKGDIKKDAWCTWDKNNIEFEIPLNTPPGEYLVRSQHVGVHGAHDGQAEFYYGCAQIKVTGNGTGVPGPMIKFPGGYKKTDPSWNFSVWGGYKDFPFPSQTVWTG